MAENEDIHAKSQPTDITAEYLHEEHPDLVKSAGDDAVRADAIGGTVEELPKGYYKSSYFIGTTIAMCVGSMASYTGWVLPSNLIAVINADIGPDPAFSWLATVNTLGLAVTSLVIGRLSDIFGRRWFIIVGNASGFIGAVMGAFAPNIKVLIVANTFLGIAAGPQLCFVFVGMELFPNKYRGYANGLFFCASLPFAAFGTLIARSFATNTPGGWRSCYYMNIAFTGVATLLFYFFYHPPTFEMLHTKRTLKQTLKTLDLIGLVLVASGLTLFLMGISWGGQSYPWKSGQVLGTLLGGLGLMVAFAVYEIFVPNDYPIIPIRLFLNKGYIGIICCAAAGSMIYYSMGVLWPLQISVMYTQDQFQIGLMSCAVGSTVLLGQIFAGFLVKAIGKQKWQLFAMALSMTVCIGSMAATNQHTRGGAIALVCLAGIFLGYLELVTLTIAPFCLAAADIGLATNILASFRSAMASLAISVYVTILNNKTAVFIPQLVGKAAVEAGLPSASVPSLLAGLATGSFSDVKGISPSVIAAAVDANKTAYAKSFQIVYFTSIAFGGCAVIASLFTPNCEEHFNEEIPRKLHAGKMALHSEKEKSDSV